MKACKLLIELDNLITEIERGDAATWEAADRLRLLGTLKRARRRVARTGV